MTAPRTLFAPLAAALLFTVIFPGVLAADEAAKQEAVTRGPADLALSFPSPFYGTPQPYRLYLPSAYDGSKPFPLLVALHGTGGDQNKYFDHEAYQNGLYKRVADSRGIIVLCPYGNDAQDRPTEWTGVGELHVLAALEDAQRRFNIDPERIVCTGQSMGGTGTTYLCCRYPDLFAAGIPLASTYGHLSLVTNLRHVPMFYVHGAKDWPIYAETGPIPITQEMQRLGYNGQLWMIEGAGHNTMDVSTERVIEWAVKQQRVAHPRHVTHRAYFPAHGRAWWVEIQNIARPGWFAEVDAKIEADNRIALACKNTQHVVLRPDGKLLNLAQPVSVVLDGAEIFRGTCGEQQQIVLTQQNDTWQAAVEPRRITPRTQWQDDVIGVADVPLTWEGTPETTLGNWLTDSMREISDADIAICTKGHHQYRGLSRGDAVQTGQKLHFMELVNWLRPSEAVLATFTLSGADLLKIIELNILDKPADEMFLVQVSGCRYTFDRSRPLGSRVVESDIDPTRTYKIVCNSSDITRTDKLHLGDYFGKLNHQTLEPTRLSTAWYYIHKNGGRISAKLEGRVVDATK